MSLPLPLLESSLENTVLDYHALEICHIGSRIFVLSIDGRLLLLGGEAVLQLPLEEKLEAPWSVTTLSSGKLLVSVYSPRRLTNRLLLVEPSLCSCTVAVEITEESRRG